jgi:DNA (cytosine-5)-methyltransferase 1
MTKFKEWPNADVNVFVGGTPCQSFSVAGLRKGLDDPRGNLMLTYLAIAKRYRPNWLVWENVPGVLSSADGRDFGSFLGGLAILGYGFAYRVLDAQYFGVAQRRKRVFVVGYLGDWRPAAAVLFERHSLQGHPAPSREKGKEVAASTSAGTSVGSLCARTGQSISVQDASKGHLMPIYGGSDPNTADTVTSKWAKGSGGPAGNECGLFVALPIAFSGQMSNPQTDVDMTQTLGAKNPMAVAQPIAIQDIRPVEKLQNGKGWNDDGTAYTVDTHATQGVAHAMAVRRLTPVECERLQGFPDNYTDIQPKGKATPDGPRYKALGNSMAVPVMAWIGKRIQEVDAICKTQQNT